MFGKNCFAGWAWLPAGLVFGSAGGSIRVIPGMSLKRPLAEKMFRRILIILRGMIGFILLSAYLPVDEGPVLGPLVLAAVEVRPFPASDEAEGPSVEAMVPEREPGRATLIRRVDEGKINS